MSARDTGKISGGVGGAASTFAQFSGLVGLDSDKKTNTSTGDTGEAGSTLLSSIDREIATYEADPKRYDMVPPAKGHGHGLPDYIFPGVSMSMVAEITGMSLSGVSRMFNGHRKPRLFTLRTIANAFTDGDTDAIKRIIRERTLYRLRYETDLTVEQREKTLARVG